MQNKARLNRRDVVLSGLAVAGMSALPLPALALTNAEARKLIDQVVADINAIINSGKSESSMLRDFENVLQKYGDVPIIARSSLGAAWRAASAAQQRAYISAFSGYLSRKYGRRFREFIGGEIIVTGAKKVSSGYLVNSVAHLQGEAPFAVDWQVSDKSGRDKMFNIIIEGISLLATERTEITAMLDQRKGDLNKLIADLKKSG
jgi:phospholipid transport system substrate-binding protein